MGDVTDEQIPTDLFEAADWLRGRHPWADHLITRACGPLDRNHGWLRDLVEGFNDLDETNLRWQIYEADHRPPTEDDAYDTWAEAGPQLATQTGRAIAPMSSGEVRLLLLFTTLASGGRCTRAWQVGDISFDARGLAVVHDWARIIVANATL